jgi:Cu2+-exporting ATPase
MAAVAVLVVTCPCALSLATPTAMLTTAGLLARHGVLVRRLQAIESLANIDTVIFDKTGTLTDAAMHLESVQTRSGTSGDQALQWAAGLADQSLHPVSRALVSSTFTKASVMDVKEFAGLGLQGWLAESAADVTGPLRLGSSVFCQVDAAVGSARRVYLADRQGWLATFEFVENVRPDARQTIATLQLHGLSVYVLSGDAQIAVNRVAEQLGISESNEKNNVIGDCTPEAKLTVMNALQAEGRKVLMVGDGLNDGPTLAAAHVSVAIGSAVPLAQAQSDFVIPGGQLSMLPIMMDHARRTLRIVKQNLAWAAVYNAVGVPLALAGWMPAWLAGLGMALSSLMVMANAARLSSFKASK